MRLLIVNQYFPPDRAASGMLLGQLAEDLATDFDITVVCGAPTYAPEKRWTPKSGRLRVIRIPLIRASRSKLLIRIVNYVLFLVGARIRTFLLPRHDVILCWTDPPVVGMIGVGSKLIQRSKFVFASHDLYPELAVAMNRMRNPLARGVLAFATRTILRFADAVLAAGDDMRHRLVEKGCDPLKIHLIPNWQDLDAVRPTDGTTFRRENGIADHAFVIMHSGNIGYSQDLDSLLEAAALTKYDPDIIYVIVGDGAREKEIRSHVQSRALTNVRVLPYQPTDRLAESLSAADLHYVSLRTELTGYLVPSKIHGILAAGRPILAKVSPDCEVARVLREAVCGMMSEGTAEDLARNILDAKGRREDLKRLGANGRTWAEANGGRARAAAAYAGLLRKLVVR